MQWSHAVTLVCLFLLLSSCSKPVALDEKALETFEQEGLLSLNCSKTYGFSFPPFANERQMDLTIHELGQLHVDRVRLAIDWRNREPSKGVYDWGPMDRRMARAREANVSVFLTVPAIGPDWACEGEGGMCVFNDESSFRDYVKQIVTRYELDKIQFGNEWETDYPGGMDTYIRFNNILYNVTKAYSPGTTVVLGGITKAYPLIELYCEGGAKPDFSDMRFAEGYDERSLLKRIDDELCGSGISADVRMVFREARYDMIDIHLYDDPLNWKAYLDVLPDNVAVVVSEFGGPSSVFEETGGIYQARRLYAYLETIEVLPVTEAYHFKLVDTSYSYHAHSGLLDENLRRKPAYQIFSSCVGDSER